jgi:hypothetical protein
MGTHDINGDVKRNAFGQVVTLEDRMRNETAG